MAVAAAAKAEAACVGPAAKSSRLVGRCPDALGRIAQASRQSWDSAARVAAPAAEGVQEGGLDLEDMVESAAEGSEAEAVAAAQAVVRAMWVAARRRSSMSRTMGWRTPSGRRSRAPFCTEGCTRPLDVSRRAALSSTSGTCRRHGSARCTGRHWRAGSVCPCQRKTGSSILRLECACTCACKGGTHAVGVRGRTRARSARARRARLRGRGRKKRAEPACFLSDSHSRIILDPHVGQTTTLIERQCPRPL